MLGLALLPNFGAVMFDKQTVLSGGGPPLGCPLNMTVSPDSTYKQKQYVNFFKI